MKEVNEFQTKRIGEITGNFIPSEGRVYRWNVENINKFLEDLYKQGNNWKLPIVVRKIEGNNYELLDGLQRLTSIYLILKYLKEIIPSAELNFSIFYENRINDRNNQYKPLESIVKTLREENRDYHHMLSIHNAIENWFNHHPKERINKLRKYMYLLLLKDAKIILYEVENNCIPIDIFIRFLNVGVELPRDV